MLPTGWTEIYTCILFNQSCKSFFPVIFSTSPLLLFFLLLFVLLLFFLLLFSYFPTVTFFPVTFFPVTFFPLLFFLLLHLSDQQFYCLLGCGLYQRFDGRSADTYSIQTISLKGKLMILTKFTSLAAPMIVMTSTFCAAIGENFVKTFLF